MTNKTIYNIPQEVIIEHILPYIGTPELKLSQRTTAFSIQGDGSGFTHYRIAKPTNIKEDHLYEVTTNNNNKIYKTTITTMDMIAISILNDYITNLNHLYLHDKNYIRENMCYITHDDTYCEQISNNETTMPCLLKFLTNHYTEIYCNKYLEYQMERKHNIHRHIFVSLLREHNFKDEILKLIKEGINAAFSCYIIKK